MFKFLRRKPPTTTPTAQPTTSGQSTGAIVHLTRRNRLVEKLVYPPLDPGIPACPVDDILDSQQALLKRLKTTASCSDAEFDARYMSPIRRLGEYIHLLPASADAHFAGEGGLFRMCLEMGFFCAQASDERIFTPSSDVETRHALEPRYKFATFLAGLTCSLATPLAAATVTDANGRIWPKFVSPIDSWLDETGIDRYWVTWIDTRRLAMSGAEGSTVIGQIIPKEAITWLDAGSPTILRDVFAVALGQSKPGESIIGDVVESIRQRVIKVDESTRAQAYGRIRCGHHAELHLLDIMRSLVDGDRWKIGPPNGPIWFGTDGLYVEWPGASTEVLKEIDRRSLAGFPRHPTTHAEMLGASNVIVPSEGNQWLWEIILPDGSKRSAVRFREPLALLGHRKCTQEDRPFASYLVNRPGDRGDATAGPSPKELEKVTAAYSLPTSPSLPAEGPPSESKKTKADTPTDETAARPTAPAPHHPDVATGGHVRHARKLEPDAPAAVADSVRQHEGSGEASQSQSAESQTSTRRSPASLVFESVRATLRDSDAEMIGRWIDRFMRMQVQDVIELPNQCVAVSQETLMNDDLEISTVVAEMDKRGWLAPIPDAPRGARASTIQFGDKKKLGFVLSADAARQLGFFQ